MSLLDSNVSSYITLCLKKQHPPGNSAIVTFLGVVKWPVTWLLDVVGDLQPDYKKVTCTLNDRVHPIFVMTFGLIRPYEGKPMVNKLLIKYVWRGLVDQAINSAMGAPETEAKSIGSLRWYLCPTFDAGRGVPGPVSYEKEEDVFWGGNLGPGAFRPEILAQKSCVWFVGLVLFLRVQGMVFITKNYSSKGGSS